MARNFCNSVDGAGSRVVIGIYFVLCPLSVVSCRNGQLTTDNGLLTKSLLLLLQRCQSIFRRHGDRLVQRADRPAVDVLPRRQPLDDRSLTDVVGPKVSPLLS